MNHNLKMHYQNIESSILLLTIGSLLIAFNWHFANYNSIYLLFWCAALSIAWKRTAKLDLESNLFATIIGSALIGYLFFRGAVSEFKVDLISRIYPLISLTGICLLATKPSKIWQHWREIIIVSFTGIPWEHIFALIPATEKISIIDAKISHFLLWYAGFDVHQTGNIVILPSGSIKIAGSCSSFNLLGLMWQVCVVICIYFALVKKQKIILLMSATAIAFIVNGIRLCLMALLVANQQKEAFNYWHGSAGAEIFTTVAILLLACIYWFISKNKIKNLDINSSNC